MAQRLETLADSRSRVAEVARNALAEGLGCPPGKVPDSAIESVVDGRASSPAGRREGEPPIELLIFDTDEIARYVFESSRPPVIEGASTLLRELNADLESRYRKWTIFSGGGEGVLLVPRGLGAPIAREIDDAYARRTLGALGVTTGWQPVHPDDLAETAGGEQEPRGGVWTVSGTRAVLARVRDRIRREKDSRSSGTEIDGSRPRCVSCRDRAGELDIRPLRPDDRGLLCHPCEHRWSQGKVRIRGTSFEDLVDDFESHLPSPAGRSRYLGFLYVDGNAMGALFGRISSLGRLRFLSLAVRGVFERVRERARQRVADLLPGAEGEPLPMIGLLGGGDEVIWILPGALAVDLAARVATWVDEETGRQPDLPELLHEAGLPGLTVGMGLVLCDVSYPVRYQYELAKALQKNAKSLFYGRPPSEAASAVDFELLTDASPLAEDLASARAVTFATRDPDFQRTVRPFDLPGWQLLLERTRAAEASDMSRSQLYQLQAGAEEGEAVFLNFLRYQVGRRATREAYGTWLAASGVDPADPDAVARFFVEERRDGGGPAKRGTWIPDALELAPFLELVGRLERRSHAAA